MTEDTGSGSQDPWTDRLSEHLDGLLSGAEAGALEAHLEACTSCRAVLDDLRAIRHAARRLEDAPPERDLWPGIREAIGAPSLTVEGSASAVPPGRRGRARGFFVTAPQLAAAAVACLLLGGAAAWSVSLFDGGAPPRTAAVPASPPPVETAGPEVVRTALGDEVASAYAPEVERLERLLASSRDRLEPRTIRVLEKNLALIDQAIRESVTALEVDPGNPWVESHLRRSWERKVAYLRETADLLEWSEGDE